MAMAASVTREGWWMDSGASHHFTYCPTDFCTKVREPEVRKVRIGNGSLVDVLGMGEVNVVGEGGKLMTLTKFHLVPELHTRLLSSLHLTSKGYEIVQKNK